MNTHSDPKFPKSPLFKAIAVAMLGAGLAMGANAQTDVADRADGSWISLSGTVTSATADSFRLDYGDGLVTVEMDDWDDFGDAYPLMDGDRVTVYGAVDNDLFEKTTIEAGSVYVEGLNTFFYASPADEEEYGEWVVSVDVVPGELVYIGTVTSVNEMTNTFTLDTGSIELSVDTSALTYDPLDDEGFQQIDVGDRVSIDAVIDADFIGDQDLLAESIVTLSS